MDTTFNNLQAGQTLYERHKTVSSVKKGHELKNKTIVTEKPIVLLERDGKDAFRVKTPTGEAIWHQTRIAPLHTLTLSEEAALKKERKTQKRNRQVERRTNRKHKEEFLINSEIVED